jgi:hypothetical protein
MYSLLRTAPLFLSLALGSPAFGACARGSGESTAPETAATVRVENRASRPVDIYLLPSQGGSTRIGFVPALETAKFSLSRALLAGAVSFRLQARPIRGGSPFVSEPFDPRSDEEIFWSIPP